MNKHLLFIGLFLSLTTTHAQKELWGYRVVYNYFNPEVPGINDGQIVKVPLEGTHQTPEVMHTFDGSGLQGKFPKGRLFQASNGKLYGVTGYGGYSGGPEIPSGVLFEYDLVVNRYKVLSTALVSAEFGVIEPLPGVLYGTTNTGNSVFKYNIDTEEFSIVGSIPAYQYNSGLYRPSFCGELMKASDGHLYGVVPMAPTAQNLPYPGGLYRINLTTNQITKLYVFGSPGPASDVQYPVYHTRLVEGSPGKLYATARGGQHFGPQGVAPLGSGTLYEYTIATNAMVKKFDFDYNINGSGPSPIIKNGSKLYGVLFGAPNTSYPYPNGSIYEYDLTSEALTILRHFVPSSDNGIGSPQSIMYASDGNFYGNCPAGNFSFNPTTDVINKKAGVTYAGESTDLIEICRKPSYQYFETAVFNVCVNTPFVFDIHNSNASTYVWKKGSAVLPLQTTGILNLPNLSVADSGIYTCTMTNECGTTVTMPLQLTAQNCLGLDGFADLKTAVKLFPNPAKEVLNIVPAGRQNFEIGQISITNMIGQNVYSTGATNSAIDVGFLTPGVYQLHIKTDQGGWDGKFVKE